MTTLTTLSAYCEDETGAEIATAWRRYDGEPADIMLIVRGVAWVPAQEIVLHARSADSGPDASQPDRENV